MLCNNIHDISINAEITQIEVYLHGDSLPTAHDAVSHFDEEYEMDHTVQAAFDNFIQSLRDADEERYVNTFTFKCKKYESFRNNSEANILIEILFLNSGLKGTKLNNQRLFSYSSFQFQPWGALLSRMPRVRPRPSG